MEKETVNEQDQILHMNSGRVSGRSRRQDGMSQTPGAPDGAGRTGDICC